MKGGDYLGKGNFACVFDASDILQQCDQNTCNINFDNNENYINPFGDEIKNLKNHAIKLFYEQDAYEDEKEKFKLLKKYFLAEYGTLTPYLYLYGNINFNNDIIRQKCGTTKTNLYFLIMNKVPYTLMSNNIINLSNDMLDIFEAKLMKIFESGIIHTDLKPDNIFINNEGNMIFGDVGSFQDIESIKEKGVISSTLGYTFPLEKKISVSDYNRYDMLFKSNFNILVKDTEIIKLDDIIKFYNSLYNDNNGFKELKDLDNDEIFKMIHYSFIITICHFLQKLNKSNPNHLKYYNSIKSWIIGYKNKHIVEKLNLRSISRLQTFNKSRKIKDEPMSQEEMLRAWGM